MFSYIELFFDWTSWASCQWRSFRHNGRLRPRNYGENIYSSRGRRFSVVTQFIYVPSDRARLTVSQCGGRNCYFNRRRFERYTHESDKFLVWSLNKLFHFAFANICETVYSRYTPTKTNCYSRLDAEHDGESKGEQHVAFLGKYSAFPVIWNINENVLYVAL
jgi:hypothetical protein